MNQSLSDNDINLKRKLIEATDSIRKKYKALKFKTTENKSELEEFYEPVTTRLKSISDAVLKKVPTTSTPTSFSTPKQKKSIEDISKEHDFSENTMDIMQRETDFPSSLDLSRTMPEDFGTPTLAKKAIDPKQLTSTPEDEKKTTQDLAMKYLLKLKQNSKPFDLTFGVYRDTNNKYRMGDAYVHFTSGEMSIWRDRQNIGIYMVNEELLDLIFMAQPKALADIQGISNETKNTFADILFKTRSIFKNFNPYLQFQQNGTRKYKEIIRPLIAKRGGNINTQYLPKEKTYKHKSNVEYVYWNKAKELVDRLRLLWSSKLAGHTGHDNEILSIIEELREEGIIY